VSEGLLLARTHDGGDSSKTKRNPSTTNTIPSKATTPIYINVQVHNKRQPTIIDTTSAVTVISQQLLKKIHHNIFVYKQKEHNWANQNSKAYSTDFGGRGNKSHY
jgi:hypothetical protein